MTHDELMNWLALMVPFLFFGLAAAVIQLLLFYFPANENDHDEYL